ncbi:MAG: hypothetical protein JXA19_06675 [Anaerolineales bacterium]|nr:hypothetical protein [Anaerolineales bacterium]
MLNRLTSFDLTKFIEQNPIKAEILLLFSTTQTVEVAASVVGTQSGMIRKSIPFVENEVSLLILAGGTRRIEYRASRVI